MKTKEEILNKICGVTGLRAKDQIFYIDALTAMEEYASQFKQSDYTPSEPLSIFPQIF